jgi:hypothetical protein
VSNVYYSPEKFDLVQLGTLDQDGLSYEYNTLVVWKHTPTGRIFWAHDQGCSCPTPFEDSRFEGPDKIENIQEITRGPAMQVFENEVDQFPTDLQSKSDLLEVVRSQRFRRAAA